MLMKNQRFSIQMGCFVIAEEDGIIADMGCPPTGGELDSLMVFTQVEASGLIHYCVFNAFSGAGDMKKRGAWVG